MSYTLKTKLNTITCQTQWCAQICDGIIFDIYLELPHTLLKFVLGFHTQEMGEGICMWQSRIKLEYYSAAYFKCITKFDVL